MSLPRPAVAALAAAVLVGSTGAATCPVASADERPAMTSVPVRDGSVLYVRYGEPGGVRITSVFTATDTVPSASAATAPAVGASTDTLGWGVTLTPELGERVRQIIREELARARPQTTGQRVQQEAQPPAGEPRDLLDVEVGEGFPEDRPRAPSGPTAAAPPTAAANGGPAVRDRSATDLVAAAVLPSAPVIREQIVGEGLFRTNLILFETAEARLLPRSREVIQVVGEVLREFPDARVRIEGHADPRGPEDFNLALSQRRAESVRDYLLDCCALASDRLEAVGYGESRPLVTGTSPTELAMNRRVEFRVLNPETLRREVPRESPERP
ncbi:MAG: OmpA family protein [Candidatus Krumholzibacteriia bacterium]